MHLISVIVNKCAKKCAMSVPARSAKVMVAVTPILLVEFSFWLILIVNIPCDLKKRRQISLSSCLQKQNILKLILTTLIGFFVFTLPCEPLRQLHPFYELYFPAHKVAPNHHLFWPLALTSHQCIWKSSAALSTKQSHHILIKL